VRVKNSMRRDGIHTLVNYEGLPPGVTITGMQKEALTTWKSGESYVRIDNGSNRRLFIPKGYPLGVVESVPKEVVSLIEEEEKEWRESKKEKRRRTARRVNEERFNRVLEEAEKEERERKGRESKEGSRREVNKIPRPGGNIPAKPEEVVMRSKVCKEMPKVQRKKVIGVLERYKEVFRHRIDGKCKVRKGYRAEIETKEGARGIKTKIIPEGGPKERELKEDVQGLGRKKVN